MKDEEKAILDMYGSPDIRTDLFSVKQACRLTGMSRAMLIKLEEAEFLKPREINEKTGYRYYDTFNIFKILQYKRLRLAGLSQNEIFEFYREGNESIEKVLAKLSLQQKILEKSIELLSIRTSKDKHYSFSFYDFDEMTCLVKKEVIHNLEEANIVGYNLSAEALSRGFMPQVSEEMWAENMGMEGMVKGSMERQIKVYQPIEPDIPDEADKNGVEVVPPCHTFSILMYGLENDAEIVNPYKLLLDEIERRELTPTGEPVRMQAIVARYTAMHFEEKEHVFRIAMPIE